MKAEKVNLIDKFSNMSDYWNPRIVGELKNHLVKLVKFKGEFVWHKHENEDEMFYVVTGSFTMKFRDRDVQIGEGEFIIVPKGIEHKPIADKEVSVMLFEPSTTLNTGNLTNKLTKQKLKKI